MTMPTNNPLSYTADEMLTPQPWEFDPAATVYEWMTAGGANTPEQIDEMIADDPDGDAAWAEMLENWTLWTDLDETRAALQRFIADRPDKR